MHIYSSFINVYDKIKDSEKNSQPISKFLADPDEFS